MGPLAWLLGRPTSAVQALQQTLLVAVLSLALYAVVVTPLWVVSLIAEAVRPRWVAVWVVPAVIYAPFAVIVSAFFIGWTTGHRLAPLLMTLALAPARVVLLVLIVGVDFVPALLAQGPLGAVEFVGAAIAVVLAASPLSRGPADWKTVGRGLGIGAVVAVTVAGLLSVAHLGLMFAERSSAFDGLPLPSDVIVPFGLVISAGIVTIPIVIGAALVRPGGLVAAWSGAVVGAVPYGIGVALMSIQPWSPASTMVPLLVMSLIPAVIMGVLAIPGGLLGSALHWLYDLSSEEDAPIGFDRRRHRDTHAGLEVALDGPGESRER